ncbi:hypothetical protein BJI49_11650 [Acetobacter pasteurianus]|nr:hypothetical protein BJI49_11650 [Acetobacter pasteurianus]
MLQETLPTEDTQPRNHYLLRSAIAVAWTWAAMTHWTAGPVVEGALLIAYPIWDAIANLVDPSQNDGLTASLFRFVNFGLSCLVATLAELYVDDIGSFLNVFAGWTISVGLLHLIIGQRSQGDGPDRRPAILIGAQSIVAGIFFAVCARLNAGSGLTDIAFYTASSALVFLIASFWARSPRPSKQFDFL